MTPAQFQAMQGRIAARAAIAKHEAVTHADAVSVKVARSVDPLWRELVQAIDKPHPGGWVANYDRFVGILKRIRPTVETASAKHLRGTLEKAYREGSAGLAKSMPPQYAFQSATVTRHLSAVGLQESHRLELRGVELFEKRVFEPIPVHQKTQPALKPPKTPPANTVTAPAPPPAGPEGLLTLQFNADAATVRVTSLLKKYKRSRKADKSDIVAQMFFPPLDEQFALNVLHRNESDGTTWIDRLRSLSNKIESPERLAADLASGQAQGLTRQQLIKRVEPHVQNIRSSAARIVRTEGLRVAQAGNQAAFDKIGDLIVGYQIKATLDIVTRPAHAARNGLTWLKASGVPERQALRMKRDTLPDEPNCFVPETEVQGDFLGGFRMSYSGKICELVTAHGNRLKVTPNHPVLTSKGFVAAGQLEKGMKLIRYLGGVHAESSDHKYDSPASIKYVFDSISHLGFAVSLPTAVTNFHGDAAFSDGKVDVVRADCKLRVADDPKLKQSLFQGNFPRVDVEASCVPGGSTGDLNLQGVNAPASRGVCTSNLSGSLPGSHPEPLGSFRVGPAAKLDASRYEMSGKSKRVASTIFPSPAMDADFVSQLFERFPGVVAFDELIDIGNHEFAGHVYDLESVGGWIVAENLFTSNCRCWKTPIMRPPTTVSPEQAEAFAKTPVPSTTVYSEWFDNQGERQRKMAVTTTRYNVVKEKFGRKKIHWGDFIDPETNDLIDLDRLKSETTADVVRRRNILIQREAKAREDIHAIKRKGFL